jgi:aurora kinase
MESQHHLIIAGSAFYPTFGVDGIKNGEVKCWINDRCWCMREMAIRDMIASKHLGRSRSQIEVLDNFLKELASSAESRGSIAADITDMFRSKNFFEDLQGRPDDLTVIKETLISDGFFESPEHFNEHYRKRMVKFFLECCPQVSCPPPRTPRSSYRCQPRRALARPHLTQRTQLLQYSPDPMDKEQARLQGLMDVSDPHSANGFPILLHVPSSLTAAHGASCGARRQVELEEAATGLTLAPVEPKVWVEKHGGCSDDSPEERSELGKGAFAFTYRMAAPGGLPCAVKRFLRRDMARAGLTEDAVRKEAAMLRQLQHPYVVRYLGLVRTRKHLLLVMELAAGGSLADQVLLLVVPARVEVWFRQLAAALEFIHWRGCVHRDIKNANLLLGEAGDLRVADFGLSFLTDSSLASQRVSRAGTSAMFSPERGQGLPYGRAADMWAAGCCAVELLTGEPITGPIWHDGAEITRKREAMLCAAGQRPPPPPNPTLLRPHVRLPPNPPLLCG